jgi:hypothetical protein
MSKIQQLSIFLENRPGQLTDITTLLSQNQLSIKSINLIDSSDYGILRVIVDDSQKAKKILDDAGISLKIVEVFAVEIDNHLGSFNEVASLLSTHGIDIQYTYTINTTQNGAFIFKVEPTLLDKTIELLKQNGIKVLEDIRS